MHFTSPYHPPPTPNTRHLTQKPSIYLKDLNFERHFWNPKNPWRNTKYKNLQFTLRISLFRDIFDPQKIRDETDACHMSLTSDKTPNTIHPTPNAKHKNLQFTSIISILSDIFDNPKNPWRNTKHKKNIQFTSRISKFSDISDAREIHGETDACQMHFTSEWTPNTIHPTPNAKHKNLQFTSRISLLSVNFDPQQIRDETDAYNWRFSSSRPAGRVISQFSAILK